MKKLLWILRDPLWQFIGALIGLIAIAWPIIVYLEDRPIYDLQVVILSNTSLVNVTPGFDDDIDITYKGQRAKNLSVVQIRLENTGNQPIRHDSYARPIKFKFAKDATIIESSVFDSFPKNIGMEVGKIGNEAVVTPTLLNPQDRVLIRFILVDTQVADNAVPFEIDARIANVLSIGIINALEQTQPQSTRLGTFVLLGGVLVFAGLLFAIFQRLSRRAETDIIEDKVQKIIEKYDDSRDKTEPVPTLEARRVLIAYLKLVDSANYLNVPSRIDIYDYGTLRIGRDTSYCDVILDVPYISRVHARVISDSDNFVLYDEGSSSGTFVNKQPINAATGHSLIESDIINFSLLVYRFELATRLDIPSTLEELGN